MSLQINKTVCDSVPRFDPRNKYNISHAIKFVGIIFGRAAMQSIRLCYEVIKWLYRRVRYDDKIILSSVWYATLESLKKPVGQNRHQPTTNIFAQLHGYIKLRTLWCLSYLPYCSNLYSVDRLSRLQDKHIFRNKDLRPLLEHPLKTLELYPQSKNHTHPDSAAIRTSANIQLVNLATHAGFRPYLVSKSSSDYNMKLAGSRNYFWPKDLAVPYSFDEVTANDCFIFIDVDHHANMNEYLKAFKPVLIFTVVPDVVAKQSDEHCYQIVNDKLFYSVKGGAIYQHYIWEYEGDCLEIIDDDGALLTYDVTQKVIDGVSDRRIVFLLPRTYTPWPYYLHLKTNPGLKRMQYTFCNIVNILHNPITDLVSIGMNLSPYSIELPGKLIAALKVRMSTKTTSTPEIGMIETYIIHEKAALKDQKLSILPAFNNPKVTAALLHQALPYVLGFNHRVTPTNVIPTTFVALGPIGNVETKPTCQIITTPLVDHPAVFPGKHVNNEIAAVNGRVRKVENVRYPIKQYKNYAREFVHELVPTPGVGNPLSFDEVIESQNKAAQKARTRIAFDITTPMPLNALETFNKSEAYEGASDPRIITTMKPAATLSCSRFVDAFKNEVLLPKHWFGPGRNPLETHEFLKKFGINGFIDTDYTRFDGSVSEFLQKFIGLAMVMRWCNPNDSNQFKHDFDGVFMKNARTSSGIKYPAGWGTRSGSKFTTIFNTVINAFVVYSALRDIGYSIDDALSNLGIYAGDDGLTPSKSGLKDSIINVAMQLGLEVKIVDHGPGQEVPYLGRIFPDPCNSNTSYQDPLRTIPKLHVTANMSVKLDQASFNKAAGYLVTDNQTPIIGNWARAVAKASGLQAIQHATNEELYKLSPSNAWPQHDKQLIIDSICKKLNCSLDELNNKCELIDAAGVGDLPLQMPVVYNNEFVAKLDAVTEDGAYIVTGNHIQQLDLNLQWKSKAKTATKPMNKNSKPRTTAGATKEKPQFERSSSTNINDDRIGSKKASTSAHSAVNTPSTKHQQSSRCYSPKLGKRGNTKSNGKPNQSSPARSTRNKDGLNMDEPRNSSKPVPPTSKSGTKPDMRNGTKKKTPSNNGPTTKITDAPGTKPESNHKQAPTSVNTPTASSSSTSDPMTKRSKSPKLSSTTDKRAASTKTC